MKGRGAADAIPSSLLAASMDFEGGRLGNPLCTFRLRRRRRWIQYATSPTSARAAGHHQFYGESHTRCIRAGLHAFLERERGHQPQH